MSWKASAYIKGLVVCPNGERISRTEKLVALVLADSHQDKGRAFTFPSVKMIAEDSLMDPRVCRRVLSSLERKGVIERDRGAHQGRGQFTFYLFPALDGKGGHDVPLSGPDKEDMTSPLFLGKRRTEGGRKEDKTAPPSIEEQEQEQVQKPTPPYPLASEGDCRTEVPDAREEKTGAESMAADADARPKGERGLAADRNPRRVAKPAAQPAQAPHGHGSVGAAVDQVCNGLAIANGRKRSLLRKVIELEMEKGESPPTTALRMIAAWRKQEASSEQLRVKYGIEKFFGNGYWKRERSWHWNEELMRQQSQASVGSRAF